MSLLDRVFQFCFLATIFNVMVCKMISLGYGHPDLYLRDDYGYTSPTCSQACQEVGSYCIEPTESATGNCKKKAQQYCNTEDEMTRATIAGTAVNQHICSTDWCFADCKHHKYYDSHWEMACGDERPGSCVYPQLDALCECEDVEQDFSPQQFLTNPVKLGIKLFFIMAGVFFCCFFVRPRCLPR